jgi:hypothetical protein
MKSGFAPRATIRKKPFTKWPNCFKTCAKPPNRPQIAPQKKVRAKSSDPDVLTGVGISPGLAIGRVYQVRGESFEITETSTLDAAAEKTSLNKALAAARAELNALVAQVKAQSDASRAAIFTAHQELLEDPDLLALANSAIDQGKTAAFAWDKASEEHAGRLSRLNNELLANRANDLRDVSRRVLSQLAPKHSARAHTAARQRHFNCREPDPFRNRPARPQQSRRLLHHDRRGDFARGHIGPFARPARIGGRG